MNPVEITGALQSGVTHMFNPSADTKTLVGESGAEATTQPATGMQPGQKIGKYEIRAQLGGGGMGVVYLAFDPLIEREVALKVLVADLSSSSTTVQRFLGEARAIGRLNHPHVVSIFDIDQWNGQYYLVMELLPGGSVADRVNKAGRLKWEEACRIVAQAARGLAAAHESGMIHRDIKPENLMLTKDGAVKVVDFGLSKLLDSASDPHQAVTRAGQILGTPHYMSPEQFESADVDARTDVYSLGATLFRLLTARFPYHDCQTIIQVMSAQMTKPPPIPTQFESAVPVQCNQIIERSMSKNPADRYQTVAEMASDLEVLLQQNSSVGSVDAVGGEIADRPLRTLVVVEPSKLQGAMLRDAFREAGVPDVTVVGQIEAARLAVSSEVPDVLVTAMQLPDGQGLDLLKELSHSLRLRNSSFVLNSSDSSLADLASIGCAASLIQTPKKANADEILRVVHAVGPAVMANGPLAAPVDPVSVKLLIILDAGRIPDLLSEVIRELGLLDVEIRVQSEGISAGSTANLTLFLKRLDASVDGEGLAALVPQTDCAGTVAVLTIDQGRLWVRLVRRSGLVAICQRPLDATRLVCLLQSGGS